MCLQSTNSLHLFHLHHLRSSDYNLLQVDHVDVQVQTCSGQRHSQGHNSSTGATGTDTRLAEQNPQRGRAGIWIFTAVYTVEETKQPIRALQRGRGTERIRARRTTSSKNRKGHKLVAGVVVMDQMMSAYGSGCDPDQPDEHILR